MGMLPGLVLRASLAHPCLGLHPVAFRRPDCCVYRSLRARRAPRRSCRACRGKCAAMAFPRRTPAAASAGGLLRMSARGRVRTGRQAVRAVSSRSPGGAGAGATLTRTSEWEPAMQRLTVRRYLSLSLASLSSPENERPALLIWPETSMPFDYRTAQGIRSSCGRWPGLRCGASVRRAGLPQDPQRGWTPSIVLIFIDGAGRDAGWYDKEHLVPFGEYVPPFLDLPFMRPLLRDRFTPGSASARCACRWRRPRRRFRRDHSRLFWACSSAMNQFSRNWPANRLPKGEPAGEYQQRCVVRPLCRAEGSIFPSAFSGLWSSAAGWSGPPIPGFPLSLIPVEPLWPARRFSGRKPLPMPLFRWRNIPSLCCNRGCPGAASCFFLFFSRRYASGRGVPSHNDKDCPCFSLLI